MRPLAHAWLLRAALVVATLNGACTNRRAQEHAAAEERSTAPAEHMGTAAAMPSAAPDQHAGHEGANPPSPHAGHPHSNETSQRGHPAEHGGTAGTPAATAPAHGYAAVTLSPAEAAAMNLTTAIVEERDFTKTLRTIGVVTPDETKTSHVHSKVRGYIESISVNYVGQNVNRGQALCAIYSQDVYAAELELLGLLDRAPHQTLSGPFADQERRAQEQVLAAARRRLALWDVPPSEVERLERTREARRTFTLSAPRSGVVVAKQGVAGMFIDPSVELYTLSDLSRVWVVVDVYEADVPFVHAGDKAKITFSGNPDKTVEAAAAFISPMLDEATRTLKVRYELDNRDGSLRPGTFATAEMTLPMGKSLAVPENAVIRTGERAIVFVVQDSQLIPREIRLGGLVRDAYRVEAGLSPGERVATGAQFLLDSESRLRATSMPGAGHAGH